MHSSVETHLVGSEDRALSPFNALDDGGHAHSHSEYKISHLPAVTSSLTVREAGQGQMFSVTQKSLSKDSAVGIEPVAVLRFS